LNKKVLLVGIKRLKTVEKGCGVLGDSTFSKGWKRLEKVEKVVVF
jgi:hypothetical protein